MNKRLLLFVIAALVMPTVLFSQTRPDWIRKKPKALNDTYFYDVGEAVGSSETEALNRARSEIVLKTIGRLGMAVSTDKVRDALVSGTPIEAIHSQYNIPVFEVCHWAERNGSMGFRAWILCQVARAGNVPPQFDLSFNRCSSDHEFSTGWAVLSSVLVPGLGQMGKRHYTEGVLTLTGELLLAGGAVATYYMGRDKLEMLQSGTLGYDRFVATQKEYNNLRTANTALWGAAAAIYVLNIYRAATIHPKYRNVVYVEPLLISTPTEIAPAVGLTLKF